MAKIWVNLMFKYNDYIQVGKWVVKQVGYTKGEKIQVGT